VRVRFAPTVTDMADIRTFVYDNARYHRKTHLANGAAALCGETLEDPQYFQERWRGTDALSCAGCCRVLRDQG
jgi:hypothetical protein